MSNAYKPENYNSLSPYLIVENAQQLMGFLIKIFDAEPLRKYSRSDGTIMHAEMKIDDSVIMLAEATDTFPAIKSILHLYLPNVMDTFKKVEAEGCEILERPVLKDNDDDLRGTFYDISGNMWSISTQMND